MRTKEFLSARGVEYESIDIANDPEGFAKLEALGLRTVPVVARGSRYVFGQDLNDIARFVGLDYSASPELDPAELVARLLRVLSAAERFGRQIPESHLGDELPNRERTYLALVNHIFEIASGFVKITKGASMTGAIAAAIPETERSIAELKDYANEITEGIALWWDANADRECAAEVETFYGTQSLHAILERVTWHCAQHGRQLMMVLEMLGISPNDPLGARDFAGLPMPENVWD